MNTITSLKRDLPVPTRPPDEDFGRTALHELKIHLVECAARYSAMRVQMETSMSALAVQVKWLSYAVVAVLAVEMLGLRDALRWAVKSLGIP